MTHNYKEVDYDDGTWGYLCERCGKYSKVGKYVTAYVSDETECLGLQGTITTEFAILER